MSDPTLADLLDAAIDDALAKHYGPMPAQVTSFTQAQQVCDAQPLVKANLDGELYDLPIVRSIPIWYPGGAGGAVTWPLQTGDVVYLIPSSLDFSSWHSSGSQFQDPPTQRRYSLNDSVAIAQLTNLSAPLRATKYAPDGLVLGFDKIYLTGSAAADAIALASKVLAELNDIKTWADLHVHTETGTTTSVPTVSMPTPNSVASTKVLAE